MILILMWGSEMKHIMQLGHALRMKQQGFCFSKAWQLAGFNVRRQDYSKEIKLGLVFFAALLIVGYNDKKDAELTTRMEKDARVSLERNVVACLNGQHISLNKTDYMDCYHYETMRSE